MLTDKDHVLTEAEWDSWTDIEAPNCLILIYKVSVITRFARLCSDIAARTTIIE
jgi:hypothetical protein